MYISHTKINRRLGPYEGASSSYCAEKASVRLLDGTFASSSCKRHFFHHTYRRASKHVNPESQSRTWSESMTFHNNGLLLFARFLSAGVVGSFDEQLPRTTLKVHCAHTERLWAASDYDLVVAGGCMSASTVTTGLYTWHRRGRELGRIGIPHPIGIQWWVYVESFNAKK